MQEIVSMSLHDATKVLNLEGQVVDSESVLKAFSEIHAGVDESVMDDLFAARSALMKFDLQSQVRHTKHFRILAPYGDQTCPRCQGTGEKFRFKVKKVEVNCHLCSKGKKMETCPQCKGTKQYETDDKIIAKCRKCNDYGQVEVKCSNCNNGIVERRVMQPIIESSNLCTKCGGLGYIDETAPELTKPDKSIDNPAIPSEMAGKLSEMIKTK
jgi:DnaJ-class molecular chaperone